ncbi:SDR family NAD(P)-dependent oxidoreductase [Bradyrhizobium sp. CCBAU 051011]|uniref:SDR family NAD(P)-dependent oxidoreductase n=1 Tax=Bradyrhizobium sp. CCBAU 051011 TaxID=858422 RepID=UPI00352B3A96
MKIEELFSVRGKIALVTGGGRGIGEMIARAYVENGAKVYITARKAEASDALASQLFENRRMHLNHSRYFPHGRNRSSRHRNRTARAEA